MRSEGGGVDRASVRFGKSRAFDGCDLHSVTFSTLDGRRMTAVIRTLSDESGGTTVATIGLGDSVAPPRDHPWVNFTAQWDSSEFRGGGDVVGVGAGEIRRVRLRFANGTIAEDTVDDGVVLFVVRGPISFPVHVDMLDGGDALIRSYSEFEGFD